jgi:hypothetical protein
MSSVFFQLLKGLLSQIGAGAQEFKENELTGSQPPRQFAPVPHWPYSGLSVRNIGYIQVRRILCVCHSREQHGTSEGHLLPLPQVTSVSAATIVANAIMTARRKLIIITKRKSNTVKIVK